VYSFGTGKAPYCIRCALVAAGSSIPDVVRVDLLSA
jgi:hypothetical protein